VRVFFGNGYALRVLREGTVELQLAEQPASGKMIVQHHRIAAIALELARSAEASPDGMDQCWSQQQGCGAFVIDRDGNVDHLHELRRAHRPVGIRVRGSRIPCSDLLLP